MATEVTKYDATPRGALVRQDFTGSQIQTNAETALAAVTARERAVIEAQYLMAERHPRNWMDVRANMLDHCKRPGFCEVARYAKPIGKKKINGQWVDDFARGFTIRFAEVLAGEMANVKPESSVTFEDDLIRIIRFTVTDLEKNIPRSREVTIAKVTEKRGKKDNRSNEWSPPEGREVIGQRINSYGDPVYLVKATDDEMRNKVNSEESKTQRDFLLKLCPRDILEECEDKVQEVLEAGDKATDPTLAIKKLMDRFREFGLMPSDLHTYVGRPVASWTNTDLKLLRELGSAIRDGMTTFDEALRLRHSPPDEENAAERDIRIQNQIKEQDARVAHATEQNAARGLAPITEEDLANAKVEHLAKLAEPAAEPPMGDPPALDAEQNRALDEEIMRTEGAKPRPISFRKPR